MARRRCANRVGQSREWTTAGARHAGQRGRPGGGDRIGRIGRACVARRSGTAPGRGRPPLRQPVARAQGCAGHAGVARERQDQGRGRRRSAGDDRHRRLRRRTVADALRQIDALGTRGAPNVRAMASAGRGRRHFRVQLSRRRLGVERDARRDLRQCHGVEAVAQDAARRAGGAIARESRDVRTVAAADLRTGHRRQRRNTLRSSRIRASRWSRSPGHRPSAATSPRALRRASASRYWNAPATTRSSSPRMRTSTWWFPPSCSAPWARQDSVARQRGG